MKLKTIILENFRCYKENTRIVVGNLTAFIGKNDIGKSAILEALEIFFNEEIIKCEHSDVCVYNSSKKIRIGCVFTDFSDEVVIDVKAKTSLKNEYLLNSDGDLEIHKIFDCGVQRIKPNISVCAEHPTIKNGSDLLLLKNSELKERLNGLNVKQEKVDLRFNPSIRSAIWKNCGDLNLKTQYIPVDKEDAKAIWESLQKELPAFALFQADRKSVDGDAEIQDPMKVAITNAVKAIQGDLDKIKQFIRDKATEVANRTLDKLREMDAGLAGELNPHFKDEPKWETLFKLSLTGDDQIPINKRGSGVRRLILLNFFRAEAERKQQEKSSNSVILCIFSNQWTQRALF